MWPLKLAAAIAEPPSTHRRRADAATAQPRWHYHLVGHKRGSVPWSRFSGDSRRACEEAVREAWALHLQDVSLPLSACPIKGIFPDAGH